MLIRPATAADAASLAKVQVDTWRAAYPDIMPAGYLGGLNYERVARRWQAVLSKDDTAVWLAERLSACSGPEVLGFAAGGRELEGDPEYTACLQGLYVLPDAQGRGLGRLLLGTAVDELIGAGHHNLLLWVLSGNPVRAYYERLGAVAVRAREVGIGGARLSVKGYAWSELAGLSARLRADGAGTSSLHIRPARAQDAMGIGQVQAAVWREVYDGIVPQSYLESMTAERAAQAWERRWDQGHTWLVYRRGDPGDEVLGFASLGDARMSPELPGGYDSELYAIYLDRPIQGQGIGGRLIALAAERLRRTGRRAMVLWSLEANAARGFYEAMGGQLAATSTKTIGGSELPVVAYGWQDLGALVERGLGWRQG